jgi:ATP adenylyltransferase
MKRIWSPWRMPYIEGRPADSGCLFCHRLEQADGPENLILVRTPLAFAILNRYPYTNGHMMVVPYDHVPSIDQLTPQVQAALMQLSAQAVSVLRLVYGAESFNLGVNIGAAAGAGVAEHIHVHIVPRWPGDTSFMATTGETRVIPEALERTYDRLRAGWLRLLPPESS